jgi:3-oxoacyl-[acyl-carrier protein] reductase
LNRIDLAGKRAVITGGAQGIGRAVAERLLASGAAVSLWDRDRSLTEDTRGALAHQGTVDAQAVDVTDLAAVEEAVRATRAALGGIDILVANAGIAGPNHNLWEYPPDAWREVIEIDLNAVFYCCRAVVPLMIAQNYGRIVNVASIAGKEGNPSASAYAAAKAGVIALTKALGKELATHDIAVNCITPAAARDLGQHVVDELLGDLIENPRAGGGRRDAVDRDVVGRELLAERLGQRDHPGLGGGIGAGGRVALLAGDRGDVDDPAVALLDHQRHDRAAAVEDRVEVDLDHLAPRVGRVLPQRMVGPGDAGIGDQDVDPAERRAGRPGGGLDRGEVGDVERLRLDPAAAGQLGAGRLDQVAIAIP